MADVKHVKLLNRGVTEWNRWRRRNQGAVADLRRARLVGVDASGADFHLTNFSGANLAGSLFGRCNFSGATFQDTQLVETNFKDSNLTDAEFITVNAAGATFVRSVLDLAYFNGVTLAGTTFQNARMDGALFKDVNMVGADLSHAVFRNTSFVNVDFSRARLGATTLSNSSLAEVANLDTVDHDGPSTIGIDTYFKSRGLPEAFLRGAGVPDAFITYATSLLGQAIEYYSCFISYASADHEFATRLHADLQARGLRTWFAPEDLKIGDRFRSRIDESIRLHDKVVLVLSTPSIASAWVEKEVETAFARERKEHKDVLFPIRIDGAVFDSSEAWVADIVNTRHVGDFTHWKRHDSYTKSLERLVRDLKRDGPIRMR